MFGYSDIYGLRVFTIDSDWIGDPFDFHFESRPSKGVVKRATRFKPPGIRYLSQVIIEIRLERISIATRVQAERASNK